MLTELVEFFENSFPEIVGSFLGIIGILIIIFTINVKILILCFVAIFGITIVYGIIFSIIMYVFDFVVFTLTLL